MTDSFKLIRMQDDYLFYKLLKEARLANEGRDDIPWYCDASNELSWYIEARCDADETDYCAVNKSDFFVFLLGSKFTYSNETPKEDSFKEAVDLYLYYLKE